jgi:hypothetical protein
MRQAIRAQLAPWWPCFVCSEETLCSHREPGIVQWMQAAPSLAAIAATRPERMPPVREMTRAAGAGAQLELFARRA